MAGELRQLNKVGGIEANNIKGISLLYELTKNTSVDCPETVVRLYLISIYWIWSGRIMGEDLKKFELDALEVFRIVRKWKKRLKNNKHKLNNSIWIKI